MRYLLLFATFLVACPSAEPGDDDDLTAPTGDDDDTPTWEFSGQVLDWSSDEGIAGIEVSVGDVVDVTDNTGAYRIDSVLAPPQPVDFYEDAGYAVTYADCEEAHTHRVWDAGARDTDEARGGDVEVTIVLEGYTDVGLVSGRLWAQTDDSWTRWSFGPVAPDQDGEGTWSITVDADPAGEWAVSVAELSGGVITWGTATGEGLVAPATSISVSLTSDGLVDSAWDGAPDERIEEITIWQDVLLLNDGGTWLQLPVIDGVPPGQERPLSLVAAQAPAQLEIELSRNDLTDCDFNRQTFEITHEANATLQVPDLSAVLQGVNVDEGEWSFRPHVGWQNVPDDPDGTFYVSLYAWGQQGESLGWTILPAPGCELDRARWPSQLPPAPPYAFAWMSAWYFGSDGSATYCTSSSEFPGL